MLAPPSAHGFICPVIARPAEAVPLPERLPAGIQLLVGSGFLVAIGYGVVAPVLPTYAHSFGVSVTAASAVVSAFAVFRLLFAPLSGTLLRALGELWVFCIGLLIVGLSSAACAYATDYGQLLTYRALGGIGSTMFTVSAAGLLIRISPEAMRGRAAGAWATGFLLGGVVGPLVGGGLSALGPQAPFLIYAGVLACTVAIVVAALPGRMVSSPYPDQPVAALPFTAVQRNPAFRAALSANFLNGWNTYGVRVALVPLFIVEHLGWSNAWAGAALTAFAAGTAATSSVGGRLADHHGRRPLVLTGLAVVAVTMALLGFSTSPVVIMVAALLSGAGTGLVNPPANATVADVITVHGGATGAGVSLAAYQMVGDVGAIVGPVVAGLVVEWWGYPTAFGLTAMIAAVAFLGWWRAPETVAHRRMKQWTSRYPVERTC